MGHHIPLTPALHQLLQHLVVAVDNVASSVNTLRQEYGEHSLSVRIAIDDIATQFMDTSDILECVHERVDSVQQELDNHRKSVEPVIDHIDKRLQSVSQSVESIEADVNLIELTTDDLRDESRETIKLIKSFDDRFTRFERRLANLEAASDARQATADARYAQQEASVADLIAGVDLARIGLVTLSDALADLRVLQTDTRSVAATPGSFIGSLPPSPPSIPRNHSPSPSVVRRAPRASAAPYIIPPRRSPMGLVAASASFPSTEEGHY